MTVQVREVQANEPAPPPAPSVTAHRGWLPLAIMLGVGALAAMFAFTDVREIGHVISQADPWLLAIPLACTIASYIVMALSYQGIAHAAGAVVPFREMLKITFVANTANYLVATGGLSGFALRLYFFTRRAIPSGTAVVISLAQGYITNVTLLAFVLFGFGYLVTFHNLSGWALVATSILLALFSATAVVTLLLLGHRRLRRRTLFILANTTHWLLHHLMPRRKPGRMRIWRFQRNLNRGIEFMLARKTHMVMPTLYIFVDWIVTLAILDGAFVALRYNIPFNFVVVGFAIGVTLSLISFIPGGLGIMEGSMAAVFASLGVPFETAVVAVLIFRVAYYVLPLVISLFFFHGMFLQGAHLRPELRDMKLPE
ncbi:MAG TPA: flippase-like domain-containing protein [Candidatus Binatia bacterium]|nr:flippase-like domain-containing protein [Candidatus Binatia bacterium]